MDGQRKQEVEALCRKHNLNPRTIANELIECRLELAKLRAQFSFEKAKRKEAKKMITPKPNTATPWSAQTPNPNLKQWMAANRLHIHESVHLTTEENPFAAWRGIHTASEQFDWYGEDGFEYGRTKEEALLKVCKQKNITPHEDLLNERR